MNISVYNSDINHVYVFNHRTHININGSWNINVEGPDKLNICKNRYNDWQVSMDGVDYISVVNMRQEDNVVILELKYGKTTTEKEIFQSYIIHPFIDKELYDQLSEQFDDCHMDIIKLTKLSIHKNEDVKYWIKKYLKDLIKKHNINTEELYKTVDIRKLLNRHDNSIIEDVMNIVNYLRDNHNIDFLDFAEIVNKLYKYFSKVDYIDEMKNTYQFDNIKYLTKISRIIELDNYDAWNMFHKLIDFGEYEHNYKKLWLYYKTQEPKAKYMSYLISYEFW